MLCLNMDVSDLRQARELLGRMVQALGIDNSGPKDTDDHSETFSESIEDLTENLIVQVIEGAEVAPERMTAAEKMDIVRTLNARGVFLLKGTVGIVASRLAASEATIYRYLQRVNG
jgi:predicted transcriptional regulator YheO